MADSFERLQRGEVEPDDAQAIFHSIEKVICGLDWSFHVHCDLRVLGEEWSLLLRLELISCIINNCLLTLELFDKACNCNALKMRSEFFWMVKTGQNCLVDCLEDDWEEENNLIQRGLPCRFSAGWTHFKRSERCLTAL